MSHTFSIHDSVTAFKVLATTAAASLLVGYPFTTTLKVEQPVSQLADFSSITLQATGQVNKTALMLTTAAAGGAAVGVALWATKGKNPSFTGRSKLQNQESTTLNVDQISHKVRAKLLTLLHSDRKTANRLLTQAKLKYPNKTTDWCADKVIYDLVRDRH